MPTLAKLGSRYRRMLSTRAYSSNPSAKTPRVSGGQSIFDFPPLNPPPPPPPPQVEAAATEVLGKERKGLKYLTYGLVWALTGATAAAGYASYAYTIDEVNEKTKAFRESAAAKQAAVVDSTGIDKYKTMLHSTALTVVAYLMKKHGVNFYKAMELVKSRRPQALPNFGFISQLKQFEKSIQGESIKTKVNHL